MTTAKKKEIHRIVEAVGRAIVEQRLAPGTRLVELKLVEALQANRNHIRAALLELSHQGLVSIIANKGAMVACPSQQEAADVFVVRRLLEAEAVVLAATRIDEAGGLAQGVDRRGKAGRQRRAATGGGAAGGTLSSRVGAHCR
ncbi:GntR family transcriptional regulator [Oceanimonas sp. NS1]|nr:GntR family transcriptional regulator [Oceanimonas sp. NS1]